MSQRLRIGLNQHEMPFTIALVHPQIPPNTGNILRLCANTGALFCSVFLHSHLQWHNYGTTMAQQEKQNGEHQKAQR